MSKDQTTQPTLFQEDSPANHSALQENGEEKMMTAISGMKLLESLPKQNQDGLLEKMLKALLTSPTVQSCNRYKKIWKQKISKSNVLLFQLQASVLGIKEKESGLLPTPAQYEDRTPPQTTHKMNEKNFQKKMSNLASRVRYQAMYQTPTTQDARIGPNNLGGYKHRMKRGSIALADQILFPTPTTMDYIDRKGMRPSRAATNRKSGYLSEMIKMYPTPTQDSASERTKKYKQGGTPLTIAAKMLPTPTNSEHKYRLKGNTQASKCLEAQARKAGGKLNPVFVEFLMGYPMNWTKVDPTE